MIRFINAKFVKSASDKSGFLNDELPQIALAGRSNVGKSSLINFVLNNKKMARTSNTPGRTRLVNYFNVNNQFYLVDLPGYGFASASKSQQESWDSLIDKYFLNNESLKLVLLLLDCRREPSKLDIMMIDYLNERRINYEIVLTKADKLSKSDLNLKLENICRTLKCTKEQIIITSVQKRIGISELSAAIENSIQ